MSTFAHPGPGTTRTGVDMTARPHRHHERCLAHQFACLDQISARVPAASKKRTQGQPHDQAEQHERQQHEKEHERRGKDEREQGDYWPAEKDQPKSQQGEEDDLAEQANRCAQVTHDESRVRSQTDGKRRFGRKDRIIVFVRHGQVFARPGGELPP